MSRQGINSIWFASEENRQKRIRMFMEKVTKLDNGCWIYDGAGGQDGYKLVNYRKPDGRVTTMGAHRWSYLVFIGDIEGTNEIDHICSNEACVSPTCLEQVTKSEHRSRTAERTRWMPIRRPRSYTATAHLTPKEYILCKIEKREEHWIWIGSKLKNGYGLAHLKIDGRATSTTAHRASYTAFVGPIPESYEINQKCRIRLCVAPDCLEAVTTSANRLHRDGSTETHCKRGHERATWGRVNNQGGRYCLHGECHGRAEIKNAPFVGRGRPPRSGPTRYKCGSCGGIGHNARTCSGIVFVAVSEERARRLLREYLAGNYG